jgi:carboxypeptidase C (cathepsin A)
MLYVDQPIGVGFSYGTDDVDSTVTAAPYVWTLIQAFFAQFPQYESRDFGLFTESYGGHYGPGTSLSSTVELEALLTGLEFASYFESQNNAIDGGSVKGEKIDLVALAINNGWYDPVLQYKAYVDFSYNNTYKPLISESDYNSYTDTYNNDCLPALKKCTATSGDNSDCTNADSTCANGIQGPISQSGDWDVYDIRQPSNDPYPPETYATYLTSSAVVKAIGAKSSYTECPNGPYSKFSSTGDGMPSQPAHFISPANSVSDARSFLATLSNVVASGIQTVIWAGDADWICNWFGGFDVANAIQYPGSATFSTTAVQNYTVSGKAGGEFKTVDNLSWLRVFGAGHEVPYYREFIIRYR